MSTARIEATRDGLAAAGVLAAALLVLGATPDAARGQDSAAPRWDCLHRWTVRSMAETEPFRVDRSPWVLRWRRTTATHSDLDGLFAELYRVEDGAKTEDQVTAVNTDHDGHEGTLTVEEQGAFWLDMESWSEETAWEVEVCVPPEAGAS